MTFNLDEFGEFGEPVATRELVSGAHGGLVTVDLGAPRQIRDDERADATLWVCPYRTAGIDPAEPITNSVAGVGSWQALTNCALIVGDLIDATGHPLTHRDGGPAGFLRRSDLPPPA